MNGRWQLLWHAEDYIEGAPPERRDWNEPLPVVPCDDEAIERVAQHFAAIDLAQSTVTWDILWPSLQEVYKARAEAALRAAGGERTQYDGHCECGGFWRGAVEGPYAVCSVCGAAKVDA